MLIELTEKQIEKHKQEIRDWVNDVLDDKYGRFAYNMLNSLMHGFTEMKDDLKRYNITIDNEIAKNRKMLGMPPLKKKKR